jgi:hypothetical protein
MTQTRLRMRTTATAPHLDSTLERAPVALVHFALAGIGPENEAVVWRLRWPENGGSQPPLYGRQTAARCSVPVDCVA